MYYSQKTEHHYPTHQKLREEYYLGKFIKTHLRYNEGEKVGNCSVKRLFHHDGILMLPHIHMHSQRILKIILIVLPFSFKKAKFKTKFRLNFIERHIHTIYVLQI